MVDPTLVSTAGYFREFQLQENILVIISEARSREPLHVFHDE